VSRLPAEAVLQESEERFRIMAETVPTILYTCRPDGSIDYQSPRFSEYTGLPPRAGEGFAWIDAVHPDDVSRATSERSESIEAGAYFEREYRLRAADGSYRWFLNRLHPIRGADGSIVKWIGVRVDIEDVKRLQRELVRAKEAAEAASEAKSRFLANISHEIRTPMTAILGFAELLEAERCTGKNRRKFARLLHRSGEALLHLLDDLVDLSAIEAGKIHIEAADCSPRTIVDEVLMLMRPRAREKKLRIAVEHEGPLPERIRTDPRRLRQILLNLVGNAIKFTRRGGVRIKLVSCPIDDRSVRLQFMVRDTGIGIGREGTKHLFMPLTQIDSAPNRRFGGTGLGWAISKRLAEALGGSIVFKSRPGKGSTFSLALQAALPEAGPSLTTDHEPVAPALAIDGSEQFCGRVLVAEDTPSIRELIRVLIEQRGLHVDVAQNGHVACRKAAAAASRGTPYDLILMDIQMPEMDGYEATRRLRKLGCKQAIVALTAHAMPGDAAKCLEAGCDAYLAKPLAQQDLLAVLRRYSRRASPSAAPRRSRATEPMGPPARNELEAVFLHDLQSQIVGLEQALADNSAGHLVESTHTLAGSAAMFGFAELASMAKDILQRATSGTGLAELRGPTLELLALCRRSLEGGATGASSTQ
jgi:PAS domain S-box-containing protein